MTLNNPFGGVVISYLYLYIHLVFCVFWDCVKTLYGRPIVIIIFIIVIIVIFFIIIIILIVIIIIIVAVVINYGI